MMAGRSLNGEWGQLMVQYWAQNENTEDSRYNQDETFFNAHWRTFYASIIKELTSAKTIVNGQGVSDAIKTNRNNILDVMLAQAFINLTDEYGDVPYSEAISSITLPKYDKLEVIYKAILESFRQCRKYI